MAEGVPAYKTRIKRGGTPTSMSSESMSAVGSSYIEYQIDSSAKRVWNRQSSATPTILTDGSSVSASNYSLNYLFGKVTFDSAKTSTTTVTVSGEYLPVSSSERVSRCSDHTLTREVDLLDQTGYAEAQDSSGHRDRVTGVKDSNVSLTRFEDTTNDFYDDLKDGSAVLIEIEPGGKGDIFRGWYLLENDNLSGGVEDLESGDVSLQLDNKRTADGDLVNMGWN